MEDKRWARLPVGARHRVHDSRSGEAIPKASRHGDTTRFVFVQRGGKL